MSIKTVAHINLRGEARQALEFYQRVFGGHLVIATHADAYGTTDPAEKDLVGWGQVVSPEGFQVMAFDVPAARPWDQGQSSYFVSVRGEHGDEISGYWTKLADGATVIVDLAPSSWSPLYGMLTDRFGVTWILDVAVAY
ncbi:VOC family protein [Actinoplanes couchii]|uniref:VOC family protein n=1 Tax=Actinoplanes couchii TaxID=403638 RepID=A0ABQ3XPQ0_9ACTN|nr:VOC family protein [Actinoplanes couchii]MDR6319150.1 PhnB protein [Actinoplanes couchii]GID60490.1 VOC family protein [Actinoplanes couchii]